MYRDLGVNKLYSFETWAQQALDFLEASVGEPAFIICNSVGGAHYFHALIITAELTSVLKAAGNA